MSAAGPARQTGFFRTLGIVVLALAAIPFLVLAAWALLFGVPTTAVLAFTVAWLLLPFFNRVRPFAILKLGISFVLLPAALALAPTAIGEVNSRVEALAGKDRTNLAAFSLTDRVGIYGLNIVMAAAGAPLYPEAALETFLMVLPAPSNDQHLRVFRSGFGMGSTRLRSKLAAFAAGLAAETSAVCDMPRTYVEWDRQEEYRLRNREARYALALNETFLRARATREGGRWRIDVAHLVGIGYPRDAYVPLLRRPRLYMEEGLFWVLQQCGWLHRYNAEWRFTVYSDDPRLRQ